MFVSARASSRPSSTPAISRNLSHTNIKCKAVLPNGPVIYAAVGDLTNYDVDVIVNAANEYMDHGIGIAGAIVANGN